MIDLRILRENPDRVTKLLGTRNVPAEEVNQLLELDNELRRAIAARDELRASINQLSKSVGELRRSGRDDEAARAQEQSRDLGEQVKALEARVIELTEARDAMGRATGGYPFLIQLVGFHSWRQSPENLDISVQDAITGIEQARRRLGSLVYAPALADTSEVDRTFLLAMARDDGPSKMGDVQRRLRVDTNYASQYRLRLIAAELIEPVARGYVDFSLPYLREFLREEAASMGLGHGSLDVPPARPLPTPEPGASPAEHLE
jgi:hypothetical protein